MESPFRLRDLISGGLVLLLLIGVAGEWLRSPREMLARGGEARASAINNGAVNSSGPSSRIGVFPVMDRMRISGNRGSGSIRDPDRSIRCPSTPANGRLCRGSRT
jgi:hypothetical protein